MTITNSAIKRRILEISYKKRLSHLGSCLTAVDIIKKIYDAKKPDEKFVLSSGHAGLALYCVLEEKGGKNAESIFDHHGVHPDRCSDCGLDCSSGSLGHGLPIAVGIALADRTKNVYVLISDGELAEGSIWEALTIAEKYKLKNLHIHVNLNGWSALEKTQTKTLTKRLITFDLLIYFHKTNVHYLPFLEGLQGHYHVMSDEDYLYATRVL